MQQLLTLSLALLSALLLTAAARADVIVSPVEIAGYLLMDNIVWVLVTVVVVVTAILLWRLWRKKK